jgi:phosphohistidine phosphatase SixA
VANQACAKHWILGIFTLACLLTSGCSDAPTPPDTTPPGPVTALAAAVTGGSVRLTWAQPGDADVAGTLVVRFPVRGGGAGPETGRAYAQGDALGGGVVVFSGRGTEATDTPPCRQQLYSAWARDAAGNWSASAQTVPVSGLPGSPLPAAPTSLAATVETAGITLSWTNPPTAGTTVRVVRKRGAPPGSDADGEVVFAGAATTVRDAMVELSPLVTWHYAVFACNPCGDCEAAGTRTTLTPTLVQSLRAGGFVVFWRHAQANVCEDRTSSTTPEWWKSCERDCTRATARQLSQLGYAQADSIGAALRGRGMPFTRVLSSEYCRATETAARMNLGPSTETVPALTFFVYPTDPCTTLPGLLAQVPRSGNTALIAHLFLPCLDMVPPLEMGEALVYRPDGRGGSTLVQRVRVSEWATVP